VDLSDSQGHGQMISLLRGRVWPSPWIPAAEIRLMALPHFHPYVIISPYGAVAVQYPTTPREVSRSAHRITRKSGA